MKKTSKVALSGKVAAAEETGETIGLDLGDKISRYCVLDGSGKVVEEGEVRNREAALRKQFGNLSRRRIALETGTQSGWISRLLESFGHEVMVANARQLWSAGRGGRKNDTRDAEKIARYARFDPALLKPIRHRSEQEQLDLGAVRARDALVRARTLLVNAARGIAKGHGERLASSATDTFGQRSLALLQPHLQTMLAPLLAEIDQVAACIAAYDKLLAGIQKARYPEAKKLQAVPGVGPLTALTFVLTISDPERFAHSRDVGPYLGLQPQQRQSGASDPQLGISKAGNRYLRKLLVQCAHHVLGPFGAESRLRTWGLRIAERGGKNAKKRAVVAVARKLAVLLHRLWTTGAEYRPLFVQSEKSR